MLFRLRSQRRPRPPLARRRPRRHQASLRPHPRLSLPNSRPNHPSCRARIHQRLRRRLLAQGRLQFRPPKLRLPQPLPVTRTATGSGSSTSLTTGPIAAHSPAQNEHRIRSACNARSSDRGTIPLLTPLYATLIKVPASVDSKPLTKNLRPLDSPLTETQGQAGSAVKYPTPVRASASARICSSTLT